MDDLMALLLDLANIVGGFLLAIGLLRLLPRVGDDLGSWAGFLAPFAWIVGIVALVTGGYFLLVHLTDGPHVFHYEVVGVAVGVALLWDRLRPAAGGRPGNPTGASHAAPKGEGTVATGTTQVTGVALLLGVFGIIAIVVGLQGLFTPN